jgi:hypothetical protein
MSKNINVNPDHYKTGGREPQGQEVVHDLQRQKLTRERANLEKQVPAPPPIPGTTGKKSVQAKTIPEENKSK